MYFHENWFSALLPPGLILVLWLLACAISLCGACFWLQLFRLVLRQLSPQGRGTWTHTLTQTQKHRETPTPTRHKLNSPNFIVCFGLFSLWSLPRLLLPSSASLGYGNLSSACCSCCLVALFAVRSNSLLLLLLLWLRLFWRLFGNSQNRTKLTDWRQRTDSESKEQNQMLPQVSIFTYMCVCVCVRVANRTCNVATSSSQSPSCCRHFRCCCCCCIFFILVCVLVLVSCLLAICFYTLAMVLMSCSLIL